MTASGIVWAEWGVRSKVICLGISVEFVILEDVPAVSSLGKLVREEGFGYRWAARDFACSSKGGIRVYCNTLRDVPFIEQNASALVNHKLDGNVEKLEKAFVTEATTVDAYPVHGDSVAGQANQPSSSSLTGWGCPRRRSGHPQK